MLSLSKLATTVTLLLLNTLPILAGKTTEFQKVFNVDLVNEKEGGCKGNDGSIEKGYNSALKVLHHASDSLNWLWGLPAEPLPTAKEDYAKFLKITQAWKLLMDGRGIYIGEGQGLDKNVEAVINTYDQYIKAHEVESNGGPNFYLRCSDHWLKYLPPTANDPRITSKDKNAQETIGKQYPQGAMFAAGLPKDLQLIHLDAKPDNLEAPYCHDRRTKAVSNKANKLLILCTRTYMLPPFGTDKYDFPKAGAVEVGQDTLDLTDSIMAITWIHEMGHYVMDWPEPKAPDPKNKNAMEPVYDMDMAISLSKSNVDAKEMPWPENLALFAAALYMDEWYWGTGTAESAPEKDAEEGGTPAKGRRSRLFRG